VNVTAKRIYLVRHAKAEPKADDDAARRLTPEGRDRFEAHVAGLGKRLHVRRIVTSPFARARQTADLLAAATGAEVEEEAALASGASTGREVLKLAREAKEGTALVGHNPEIAEAIALACGRDREVKPGAVAELSVDGREVTLAWLELP
jgi:phosphohistidine phosphatase